jgi:hypothetical protein
MGVRGYTGSQGVSGFVGSRGFVGSAGLDGAYAARGYTGSQGSGFVGSQGNTGFTGSFGVTTLVVGNVVANTSVNLLTSNLSFTGNNGINVSVSSNQIKLDIGKPVVTQIVEPVITGNITTANLQLNYANSSAYSYTVRSNFTLLTPNNMPIGSTITVILTQDETGSKIMTANSQYKFAAGVKDLSSAAGAVDMLNIFKITETQYLAALSLGYV